MRPLCLVLLCFGLAASWAEAYQSTHVKSFNIAQCSADSESCFKAVGDVGFISASGDTLQASNVRLQYSSGAQTSGKLITKSIQCAVFQFQFNSQALRCDNRSISGGQLMTFPQNKGIKS